MRPRSKWSVKQTGRGAEGAAGQGEISPDSPRLALFRVDTTRPALKKLFLPCRRHSGSLFVFDLFTQHTGGATAAKRAGHDVQPEWWENCDRCAEKI